MALGLGLNSVRSFLDTSVDNVTTGSADGLAPNRHGAILSESTITQLIDAYMCYQDTFSLVM